MTPSGRRQLVLLRSSTAGRHCRIRGQKGQSGRAPDRQLVLVRLESHAGPPPTPPPAEERSSARLLEPPEPANVQARCSASPGRMWVSRCVRRAYACSSLPAAARSISAAFPVWRRRERLGDEFADGSQYASPSSRAAQAPGQGGLPAASGTPFVCPSRVLVGSGLEGPCLDQAVLVRLLAD